MMRSWLAFGFALVAILEVFLAVDAAAQPAGRAPSIVVYKGPTWDCCSQWVVHLRANGFNVQTKDVFGGSFADLKRKHGVPDHLYSCHTAIINGYVIEGHVPADLIKRLLKEKPAVVGLAVPGMPIGSPGMEGPNPQPYEIFTFDKQGRTTVYARR